MPLQLRPATSADREAVLALVPRLRAFGPVPLRSPDALDGAERAALAAALADPRADAAVLVAVEGDGPALGVVYVHEATDYFTGETHGHVGILVVAAAAEGRGVGRALLAAAEAWSTSRGHRFVTLNVFAANDRARAVYERVGFAPDTVRYYKALGAPERPER